MKGWRTFVTSHPKSVEFPSPSCALASLFRIVHHLAGFLNPCVRGTVGARTKYAAQLAWYLPWIVDTMKKRIDLA